MRKLLTFFAYLFLALPIMAATPAITSPKPGSTFAGSEVYFQWSPSGGPVQLHLNTASGDPAATRFYSTGTFTAGALDVAHIPTNGAPVWVTLLYEVGNAWFSTTTQYTEAGTSTTPPPPPPPPASKVTGVSCGTPSGTTINCQVTISPVASGTVSVTLSSSSATITVPSTVTVASGATTGSFVATSNPIVLTASGGGATQTLSVGTTFQAVPATP